jgi:hypothetical protein
LRFGNQKSKIENRKSRREDNHERLRHPTAHPNAQAHPHHALYPHQPWAR